MMKNMKMEMKMEKKMEKNTEMKMGTKTVMTITGIRPDFIRMSHIFKELDKHFNHILIHTGQHYENLLSDVFFTELNIRKPDYILNTGSSCNNHYEQLGYLSCHLIELLKKNELKPDIILFLGDSNSVCVSLPLKKEGYKIGHIEAGMRSYDKRMFEEINRTVCDHCSDILFVYHDDYKQYLQKENVVNNVFVVGNTIIEPCLEIIHKFKINSEAKREDIILIDIHRRENFNDVERMKKIIEFANLAYKKYNIPVKMLYFKGTMDCINNESLYIGAIEIIPLMSFKQYLQTAYHSKFVISDSGTAVEELPLLNTPVLCPRDYTERPMSYTSNCSYKLLLGEMEFCIDNAFEWIDTYKEREKDLTWLGDGKTSKHIIDVLKSYFGE